MSFDGVDDVLKIKPVVELKEDKGNHVYKTDFRGHLQLVSVDAEILPNKCNVMENNLTVRPEQWEALKSSPQPTDNKQLSVPWKEESTITCSDYKFRECKTTNENKIFVKEELIEVENCTYSHSIPKVYEYSSDSTWETPVDCTNSIQSSEVSSNGNLVILTNAEKKKMYRLKIKEENPAMWTSIKIKEAARKRELREQRRQVIFEMQRAMEMASQSSFAEEQQMYLEALKDRYPDIWNQLMKALPETERRNQQLFIERTTKSSSRSHAPKPVTMYKDVIEAQKKRLYRQRLKEQRPEMYARQKARDSYSRSIQRMLAKANNPASRMGYYTERHFSGDMEMCHPNLNIYHDTESLFLPAMHSKDTSDCSLAAQEVKPAILYSALSSSSPVAEVSVHSADVLSEGSKSSSSNACDNEHLKNNSENPKPMSNSCDNKEPNDQSAASTTQSNVLWYWNDVKVNSTTQNNPEVMMGARYWPIRLGPRVLTEEERLEKAERERLYLKEKRRRIRMSMTPEQRTEFLRMERERLKQYRKKKKSEDT